MRKSALLPLLAALLAVFSASAQTRGNHSDTVRAKQDYYTHGVGWIHTHIGTNWYLSAEGTTHLYYGYEDRLGPFRDRLSYELNGYIGRWVFPMVGIRIGAGIATYNGFLSHATFDQGMGEGFDNIYAIGYGACDYRPDDNTPLGGYYHFYNDELYRQPWVAVHLAPDLMINLSYANFYNPKKLLTSYAYIGVAFHVGLTENTYNLQGNLEVPWEIDPNTAASVHVGLQENLRLGKHFNLYGDVRLTMYEGRFDREEVVGVETGMSSEDFGLSARLGLSYRFNFIGKKRYADWYRAHIDRTLEEGAAAPDMEHLYTTHRVYLDTVHIYDTVWETDLLSEFDPRLDPLLDSLVRDLIGDKLDSLDYLDCDTCTLRDILTRHLIPYEMVFYEIDKWDIRSSEVLKIAKMARLMKDYPQYTFLLFGSADSKTGTVQRNEFLSVNRADVVYNKLVYEYGIPPAQLKRIYLGGILDYEPFELNRATVIIMEHPKVMEEFMKLRAQGQAGGSEVEFNH